MNRRAVAVVLAATAAGVLVPLAASRDGSPVPVAVGQIVPGPPTTPQPTVPCTPVDGCGRGPGTLRDVAYAWIDRYCNGDAVPTPPGQTTFALNYGLGGQSSGPVQFAGVLEVNGTVIPSSPLAILEPGQKDTRIRTAVVPDGAVFTVTLTGTVLATGTPVIFGNGTTTRVRMASGSCGARGVPGIPPRLPPFPTAPPPVEVQQPPPITPDPPPVVVTAPPGTVPPAL